MPALPEKAEAPEPGDFQLVHFPVAEAGALVIPGLGKDRAGSRSPKFAEMTAGLRFQGQLAV